MRVIFDHKVPVSVVVDVDEERVARVVIHDDELDPLAVRDRPADVAEFLARRGDPFERIGADPESRAQLALGSSGVPETFIVDGAGIIRYQHMGPIESDELPELVAQWEAAQ